MDIDDGEKALTKVLSLMLAVYAVSECSTQINIRAMLFIESGWGIMAETSVDAKN